MNNFYDNKSQLFQALREFADYLEDHVDTDDHGTETTDRIYDMTKVDAEDFGLPEDCVGKWLIEGVKWSGYEGTDYQYCKGCHRVEPTVVKTIKYVKVK